MSILKKEQSYNISIVETMVKENDKSIYAGYILPDNEHLNQIEFNIYVDDDNNIIHIYDPFKNNTTSIVNMLSESFVKELCDVMKVKAKRYVVYVYMAPIHEHSAHITAYDYKNDNEFYSWDKTKLFEYFVDIAEREGDLI